MKLTAISTILFGLGVAAPFALAQPVQLDPEGFGKPPVAGQQSIVSVDSQDLGDGFVPALRFRRAPVRPVADATGLLDLLRADQSRNACTAVLISPTILMTNAHCVPATTGPERVTEIRFITGFEDANRTRRHESLRVDPQPIERHPAPLDFALLRLLDTSRQATPLRFEFDDPEPDEKLFIVGHPKGAPKHVSDGHCFAANDPLDGDTLLHECNTHGGNSGSFIVSYTRNKVVGLHKAGAQHGAQYNMGTRMTRIASTSAELSKILGTEFTPRVPAPPKPVAGDPVSMVEACDRYAGHPYNPDNPPGFTGVDWNDMVVTDAIAICDAALALVPRHNRVIYNLGRAYQKNGQYEKALELYERGLTAKYAAAIHNMGSMYRSGTGVETDASRALEFYQSAADLGHPVAALELGDMYRDAVGVERDYDKAMDLYETARKGGYIEGAAKIGWLYSEGLGVAQDKDKALEWYKVAMQGDVDWAYNNAGWINEQKGNYAQARAYYQRALDLGHETYPNTNLGRLYEKGLGVEIDYAKAEAYYLAADAAGRKPARRWIGDLYRDRTDGKADPQKALEHYQIAMEAGDKEAFANAAWLYDRRFLKLKDDDATDAEALRLYDVAVKADVTWAKRRLGRLYRYGLGTDVDYPRALSLFREASDAGDGNSKVYLAEMYAFGMGLPVDGRTALNLLEEATEAGNDWARGKQIALLALVPDGSHVLDAENYRSGDTSAARSAELQLWDINLVLAWLQVVGIVDEIIPEREGTILRKQRIQALETFDPADLAPRLEQMHAKARVLLRDQIGLLETRPDDGWLWGGFNSVPSQPWLTILYGPRPDGSSVKLEAADIDVRNRLLRMEAEKSAKYAPDGPIVYYTDGTSEPMPTRIVQSYLDLIGFNPGSPDGKMGPATRRALSAFQRAIGLPVTGQPDGITLHALDDARWAEFKF